MSNPNILDYLRTGSFIYNKWTNLTANRKWGSFLAIFNYLRSSAWPDLQKHFDFICNLILAPTLIYHKINLQLRTHFRTEECRVQKLQCLISLTSRDLNNGKDLKIIICGETLCYQRNKTLSLFFMRTMLSVTPCHVLLEKRLTMCCSMNQIWISFWKWTQREKNSIWSWCEIINTLEACCESLHEPCHLMQTEFLNWLLHI